MLNKLSLAKKLIIGFAVLILLLFPIKPFEVPVLTFRCIETWRKEPTSPVVSKPIC